MRRPTRFTVTEEHLKLLRRFYVGWCGDEYGAPEIDPKRPYGNSDVETDIAEILGESPAAIQYGEPVYSDTQRDRYRQLHKETQTVLQIALRTGRFETGTFECGEYDVNWQPASPAIRTAIP